MQKTLTFHHFLFFILVTPRNNLGIFFLLIILEVLDHSAELWLPESRNIF